MEVYIVPMLGDNLSYYVTLDAKTQPGIWIDVAEPHKAKAFMESGAVGPNIVPAAVFTTHKHMDHSGGNIEMKTLFPDIQIFGGLEDNVPGATINMIDGQEVNICGLHI